MSLIGKEVSEFSVQAYLNEEFKTVTKENILGQWSIFFFYPADFTFVCPTELEDLANKYQEFKDVNCEIYSVSCDSHFVHKAWHDASDTIKKITYPMLADPTAALARDFEVMIESDGMAERGSFIVNPEGKIVALYNVAGPGKEIPESVEARIHKLDKPVDIKVLISLSCTMCPEVVVGSQQIAAKSELVNATMIDLMHAPDLKEKYKVMSVPCMIINDKTVSFGKKNIEEILDLIETN